jgi:hypothetical protein
VHFTTLTHQPNRRTAIPDLITNPMRYLLVLALLTVISCAKENTKDCNYITDYYQHIYKAENAFLTENYKEAFDHYQTAFNNCVPVTTIFYYEKSKFAETAAVLKEYELALEYAEKAIIKGTPLSSFENKSNFAGFFSTVYGDSLVARYPRLRKHFEENVDLELRKELLSMRYNDQIYRGGGGIEVDWDKQDSIDKINERRLIELFEQGIYPNEELVGPYSLDNSNADIGIMLLHTKDSIRLNYFVPKVKEFVIKGKAPPVILGNMIDQYHLYNGQPQIYGTYKSLEGDYSYMIDDLKKVDSNRISIGLPPLKLQEKRDSIFRTSFGF